jgi:tetratricopeptide (TPR) repeat protein
MTLFEHALQLIETTQYAKFFAFVKPCIGNDNALASLQKTFIAGKTTADFPEQLETFIGLHQDRLSAPFNAKNALPSATFLTTCPTRDVFIGRQGELLQLHTHLEANKHTVVVNGLDGIGKTSLACEYIKQYEHTYTHIVWLVQNSSLFNAFIDCEELIEDLKFTQEPDNIKFKKVLKKLSECEGKNLLIIDNFQAHNLDIASKTLSYFNTVQMRHWKIIFTSREKIMQYQPLDLDTLPEKDAIALFKKHCPEREIVDDDLKILLHEIGYHTLLIELLARIYNSNHDLKNLPALTAKMQQKAIDDKDLQDSIWAAHSEADIKLYDYLLRIFNIEALDENARYILKHFAVLPAEAQEYERFLNWIGDETRNYSTTLNELVKKGWLAYPEQGHYQIHRLIQMLMLKILQPTYQDCATLHNAIGNLLFSDVAQANPLKAQGLIRYGESLLQYINYQNDLENKVYLQNKIGCLYIINGNYAQALSLFEQALQIRQEVLGEKHPDTAESLNNIAGVYDSQGHYAKALPLYEQALQIQKEVLGEKHTDTAISLNNIAILYYNQSNYAQALPLFEEVLQIHKEILGEKHSDTAISLNNIAGVYDSQGHYAKALPLYEQALQIQKEILGEKHPDTANSLNNIAMLYQNQGDYTKALPLLEEALQMRKEVLGEKHPDTISSIYNIGTLYFYIKEYDKAKSSTAQAYQIWQEILGEEHPHTQNAKKNLAYIVKKMQEGGGKV